MTRLSMTAPGQAERVTGAHILLIDDEPRICDFIRRALETAGYVVDSVASGAEGLQRALEGDYDLVILDLIMPDVDGRRVLAQLVHGRREPGGPVRACPPGAT